MNLRVLRYFLAVVEEESITGAADILMISQPTLSRQLKELEDELGKQLFIRGSRTITLTPEGELLRDRAQEIIELTNRTSAEISTMSDQIAGDIYIGAGETHAMRILGQVANDLREQYPRIRCNLFSGNAVSVSEQLDNGLLDFAIVSMPADTSKYDYVEIPATDIWGLLMRKDHPLASHEAITSSDLDRLPVFISSQPKVSNELSGWRGVDAERLNIVGTYNLLYNAAMMVSEGFGNALCFDRIVDTSADSNLCFRPLTPRLSVRHALIWKSSRPLSRPAVVFLDTLRTKLATMGGTFSL
ncbi:LysR family transcriptional regulator [Bifidobacterium lemurum]|uniref:LysR family transcriptional regulator n=1 Tax=Bifidobacterium lemurum TaxID=1603886 RepID=A0A261FW16_9BIFI|nr:LysR family transcriptional regulator [Bifidobacterium lemurum]OZG63369.1 LysR family transcriptional regulator [Bifidobacterium lemurum]QOL34277.1 LysR family transcriptional regulator [Bifidobacterium lemurum]